jgi:hypothetical protein
MSTNRGIINYRVIMNDDLAERWEERLVAISSACTVAVLA